MGVLALSADMPADSPVSLGEPFADELALARAVARGDRPAAERFARRLAPTVRRVARLLLRGGDSDDAVQTCLIELLRSAGGYEGRGSLEGWAHRIAVRVALRSARRTRDQHAREELRDDLHDAGVVASEPGTLGDDLPRPLHHYLDAIGEAHRSVLVLRHALGHTVPEIAEICAAPVPTVKSRLLKAQAELRRLIQRDINLGVRNDRRPS
jgi:RNA polymerase sigma-70 factor (ECF subfamily)